MRVLCLFFSLILLVNAAGAQDKIVQHKGDGGQWIHSIQTGYVITKGTDLSVDQARKKALLAVKEEIIRSVAEQVSSTSALKVEEISGAFNTYVEEFEATTTTQSVDVSAITGISETKVEKWYWEKIKNKDTKAVFYNYYVLYPFSENELNGLIQNFKAYDNNLTQQLNALVDSLHHASSLENVNLANEQLKRFGPQFYDQRQQIAKAAMAYYQTLIRSLNVVAIENNPGDMLAQLSSGDRFFSIKDQPRVTSPCAEIYSIEQQRSGTRIGYNFDYCKSGSNQNYIEIYYRLGNIRIKDQVHFDPSSQQIEFRILEPLKLTVEDSTLKLQMPINARFATPFTINTVLLTTENNEKVIFNSINQSVSGKGNHQIKAETVAQSQTIESLTSDDNATLSGQIEYTAGSANASKKIYRVKAIIE